MSLAFLDPTAASLALAAAIAVLAVLGVVAGLFALAAWGAEPEAVECEWDEAPPERFRGPGAPTPGAVRAARGAPA